MLKSNKPNTKVRVLWGSNEVCTTVKIPTLSCVYYSDQQHGYAEREEGGRESPSTPCAHIIKEKNYEMNLIKVRSPRGPFCALRLSTSGCPGINRTLNVAHKISMVLVPGNTSPPKLTVMGSLWVLGFCQGRRCCLTYGEDSTDGSISAGEKKNQSPGHTLPLCAAVIFFSQQTAFWISEHQ